MKITVTSLSQLNALVAEKLMGREVRLDLGVIVLKGGSDYTNIPNYSTDLNAAEVVARKYEFTIQLYRGLGCSVHKFDPRFEVGETLAAEDSLAIAICLAALRCEGVEVELQLQEES